MAGRRTMVCPLTTSWRNWRMRLRFVCSWLICLAFLKGWHWLWPRTETCSGLDSSQIPCQGDNDPNTIWGPFAPAVQAQGNKLCEERVVLLHLRVCAIGNQVHILKIREQRNKKNGKMAFGLPPWSVIGWGKEFQNKSRHSLLSLLPQPITPRCCHAYISPTLRDEGSWHQNNKDDDDHDNDGASFVLHTLRAKNGHTRFSNIISDHPTVFEVATITTFRWGNWGSEVLDNYLEFTLLLRGGANIWIQIDLAPKTMIVATALGTPGWEPKREGPPSYNAFIMT